MAKPQRRNSGMDEADLLRILKDEEKDAASYYTSDLAAAQEDAMKRFYAEKYGDEVEGRSSVVSHDIEDTINWIMPDLMRTFLSSDELVTIEPNRQEDEAPEPNDPQQRPRVEVVADYLDHIYQKDNDGETNTYDFAFDGLLQRIGIMHVGWKAPEAKPPRRYEGLHPAQLIRFVEDEEYEIVKADQREGGEAFDVEVIHKPRHGRVCITAVPPEEFAISRRARSIAAADYHRRKREVYIADMCRMYPDQAARLDPNYKQAEGDEEDITKDGRVQARFPEEAITSERDANNSQGRKKDWLMEEFIRIDYDGDSIVELRHVKRIGDVMLENEAVEFSEFAAWTPYRISHKIAGRSIADVLLDLQKIRTVITRRMLDGLSQALTPQRVVNTDMADPETYDDLTENMVGGHIRVRGPVDQAIRDVVTPDVTPTALTALEHFDQRVEQATGVTRHSQGIDPTALNKTATGIELLQAAAKVRIEMIARWLGMGIREVYQLTLKQICAHQDGARQVKLNEVWTPIDPRTWSDEMSVSIHVGMSASSREQQLVNLLGISQKQEQILLQMGPSNPLCSLKHYRNTLVRISETQGYKDPSRFWGEIPEDWQPPPQQDPKMVEVQAKMQLQAAEKQHKSELQAQEMQFKQQLSAAEFEHETQMAELKVWAETKIAEQRMRVETALAIREQNNDLMIENRKADAHVEATKTKANAQAKAASAKKSNGKSNGSSVRMGGKIG